MQVSTKWRPFRARLLHPGSVFESHPFVGLFFTVYYFRLRFTGLSSDFRCDISRVGAFRRDQLRVLTDNRKLRRGLSALRQPYTPIPPEITTLAGNTHQMVAAKVYPVCIAGARVGPPEDISGHGGYDALLDRVASAISTGCCTAMAEAKRCVAALILHCSKSMITSVHGQGGKLVFAERR